MRLTLVDHPLVQHKLAHLRDERTGPKEFRGLAEEIAMLMAYEAMRDLELAETTVKTPLAEARVRTLAGKKLALVAILRAGLVMAEGILKLVPHARVGHIGLYRDPESLKPVQYYLKLPQDIGERRVFLLDPMLATGGSASLALSLLKAQGASGIKLMVLIAAPEGLERLAQDHPDVEVVAAAVDERLNEHGYILPGLGDAGDRLYGTR